MSERSYGMYLAYLTQAFLGMNVLIAVFLGSTTEIMIGGFMFLIGMVPHIFTWKTKIVFPWFVYFLVSLALLIHASGYIQERYITIPHWDKLAHFVSGSIVARIGFIFVMFMDKIRRYSLDPPFMALFIVFFGMAGEYIWEIYEFMVDTFFGGSLAGKMQASNTDTMMDMIFVLVPSIIVAVGCYYYLNHYGKENIFHNMVKDSPFFPE